MNQAAPHSVEAEQGVLGSMLISPRGTIAECVEKIEDEYFYVPAHRTIYSVLVDLWNAGQAIDLITFTQVLRDRNLLESVGGAAFVTEVFNFVPTAANVEYYIDIVRDKYELRRLIRLGTEMTRQGANGSDPAEIAAFAEREIFKLRQLEGTNGEHQHHIQFFTPSQLRDFRQDNESVLIGDCHIVRGEVFVIGGEPGVGKSRAATQLGVSGATRRPWFGFEVRQRFKTMIVQTENGRYRLQQEFSALNCDEIESWLLVSEPPPFGLELNKPQFQTAIIAALRNFKPDCVILDPWNAAARDDKQKDYNETFDALRGLLPTGADRPALGVVAHTRKPQLNEKRTGGTCLQHLLAGSYVLSSRPRCIFVMVPGSDDETDNSIVFFNPKNNDGKKTARSAWRRTPTGFTAAADFDWAEFDKPPDQRRIVGLEHIREVFDGGEPLELKEAAHRLATIAGIKERSAYNALASDGKFSASLKRTAGRLSFIENL
jgi:hypothetical protein